jgi:hypothetical protein
MTSAACRCLEGRLPDEGEHPTVCAGAGLVLQGFSLVFSVFRAGEAQRAFSRAGVVELDAGQQALEQVRERAIDIVELATWRWLRNPRSVR